MFYRQNYFIREHVGLFKWANTYDILDPDTQKQIGIAVERPGWFIHLLRFVVDASLLPTTIHVYIGKNPEAEGRLLFSMEKNFAVFSKRVSIRNPDGQVVGWFQSKVFTIGGAFDVFNAGGEKVFSVKGNWVGWEFQFLDADGDRMGTISKKWGGMAKELFTTADNYVISIDEKPAPELALLFLAAGLAIDTVYKERKG